MIGELILSSYTLDQGRIILNDAFSAASSFNTATFNEVNSTLLSGGTIYSGNTDLYDIFQIYGSDMWMPGSTGNYSIKANNDSGTDATGNYAVAEGFKTTAIGNSSHASGYYNITNALYSQILGGSGNTINISAEGSAIIGSSGITATQPYTTYVDTLNIKKFNSGSIAVGLGIDSNGNVVSGNTSLLSSTFQTLTDGTTITWGYDLGSNAFVTLGGNRTLSITGISDGASGMIVIKQDGSGNRTLSFAGTPGTHKVVNGGGGSVLLTSTASAEDIISFVYRAATTTYYWNIGYDYN